MAKKAMDAAKTPEDAACYDLKDQYYDMMAVCVDILPRSEVPDTAKLNQCMEKENFCS